MALQDAAQDVGQQAGENLQTPEGRDAGLQAIQSILKLVGSLNQAGIGSVIPGGAVQGVNQYMIDSADKALTKFYNKHAEDALTQPGGLESLMSHAALKDQLESDSGVPGANYFNTAQPNGATYQPQEQPTQQTNTTTATSNQNAPNGATKDLNTQPNLSAMDILKGILPYPFAMPDLIKNKIATSYGETPQGRLNYAIQSAQQVPMGKAAKQEKELEMIGSLPANQIAGTEALAKLIPAIQATMTPAEKIATAVGQFPPQLQNVRQQLGGTLNPKTRKIEGGAAGGLTSALQGKIEAIKKLHQENAPKAGQTSYGMGWKIKE